MLPSFGFQNVDFAPAVMVSSMVVLVVGKEMEQTLVRPQVARAAAMVVVVVVVRILPLQAVQAVTLHQSPLAQECLLHQLVLLRLEVALPSALTK